MDKHKSFFKKKEFGKIDFGNIYKGKKWTDKEVSSHWLEYVASDKCFTSEENKEIARAVLQQRGICDGQIEDERLKG